MSKLTTKINTLYFVTLLVLMLALIVAWKMLIIPFVQQSEKTKADLLFTPYAPMFESLIDNSQFEDLNDLISQLMLLRNESNDKPLILKLELLLDDGRVIKQQNESRESLFKNSTALFSPSTFELLGSVEIHFNDYTYNEIVDNSLDAIVIAVIVGVLLFIAGFQILSRLVQPLSILSEFLNNKKSLRVDSIPQIKRSSDEIDSVWKATNLMLERINRREKALKEEHKVSEKALREKIEAQDANKAKTNFLANMSHEIRTPLTAIIGFADSLLDPNIDIEKRNSATKTIIRNGNHLLEIINDILDLSKIESEKLEVESVDTFPVQIIKEIVSVFEPILNEKGLKLDVDYQFPLPKKINSDPTRIRQILFNLLSNANKFTEKGGVSLSIRFEAEKGILQYSVTDTGIGLSKKQADKIFSPFSQADSSTTRKFGGTGLGLTISRKLARMLGGDLNFTSTEGVGTKFVLDIQANYIADNNYLNQLTDINGDELVNVRDIDVSILTGNILVAEDTKDIQDLVEHYLGQTSAKVTIVNNGEEAVEKANNKVYDVILMDMQMPVLDGIGATKLLRSGGYDKPIVALTANAMQEDQERYKVSGLDDFVAKPIDKNELFRVLFKYLPEIETMKKIEDNISKLEKRKKTQERLKKRFMEQLPEWLAKISLGIKERNQEQLVKNAHVLKGLGGSFGFPEVTDIAAQIEIFGKDADFDSAESHFKKLKDFCENID